MRLLLDEHIPRDVAMALRKRFPALDALSIYDIMRLTARCGDAMMHL